jgi:hypothetical protein
LLTLRQEMETIGKLAKLRIKKATSTDGKGATYQWQDTAVRYAEKLGVKPDAEWFRVFKYTPYPVLSQAYSYCYDRKPNAMKYFFFKMVSVFRKESK